MNPLDAGDVDADDARRGGRIRSAAVDRIPYRYRNFHERRRRPKLPGY